MKSIQRKLSSNEGASIIIGLVFFLFCSVIGAIVLTSAYSNMGRLTHMREEQQSYLTVSSAVRLIRNEIDGMSIRFEGPTQETRKYPSGTEEPISNMSGVFFPRFGAFDRMQYLKNEILDLAYAILIKEDALENPKIRFTISPDESGEIETVYAIISMDDDFNITILFSMTEEEEPEHYDMFITLRADVEKTIRTEKNETFDNTNGELLYTTIKEISITTIKWTDCQIEKVEKEVTPE